MACTATTHHTMTSSPRKSFRGCGTYLTSIAASQRIHGGIRTCHSLSYTGRSASISTAHARLLLCTYCGQQECGVLHIVQDSFTPARSSSRKRSQMAPCCVCLQSTIQSCCCRALKKTPATSEYLLSVFRPGIQRAEYNGVRYALSCAHDASGLSFRHTRTRILLYK